MDPNSKMDKNQQNGSKFQNWIKSIEIDQNSKNGTKSEKWIQIQKMY